MILSRSDAIPPGGLFCDGFNMSSVIEVCRNMREWDRREIFALREYDSAMDLAMEIYALRRQFTLFNILRTHEAGPAVAVFGVVPRHPGVATVGLFATPEFSRIAAATVFWIREHVRWHLFRNTDLHRLECKVLCGHRSAERFVRYCGARSEGIRAAIGRNREDYQEFVWLRSELEAI